MGFKYICIYGSNKLSDNGQRTLKWLKNARREIGEDNKGSRSFIEVFKIRLTFKSLILTLLGFVPERFKKNCTNCCV